MALEITLNFHSDSMEELMRSLRKFVENPSSFTTIANPHPGPIVVIPESAQAVVQAEAPASAPLSEVFPAAKAEPPVQPEAEKRTRSRPKATAAQQTEIQVEMRKAVEGVEDLNVRDDFVNHLYEKFAGWCEPGEGETPEISNLLKANVADAMAWIKANAPVPVPPPAPVAVDGPLHPEQLRELGGHLNATLERLSEGDRTKFQTELRAKIAESVAPGTAEIKGANILRSKMAGVMDWASNWKAQVSSEISVASLLG